MDRKQFLTTTGLIGLAIFLPNTLSAMSQEPIELLFKDDGKIPNSKFPLILYRNAFEERGNRGAAWLEQKFASNNWTNSWRNGIYSFHHYHSTSHEVLGVYAGQALVHLGGEAGSYQEPIKLGAENVHRVYVTAPVVEQKEPLHFILKVTDKGAPALSRYKRVIVTVEP